MTALEVAIVRAALLACIALAALTVAQGPAVSDLWHSSRCHADGGTAYTEGDVFVCRVPDTHRRDTTWTEWSTRR